MCQAQETRVVIQAQQEIIFANVQVLPKLQ